MGVAIFTGLNSGDGGYGTFVGGEGPYLLLDDGRRLLDASNTGGPLGHCHPAMVAAMREAVQSPVISEGWFWPDRERAARDLLNVAFADEADWVGAVRFVLSGSEANDLALSLAQAVTGRSVIATRERAYHGLNGLARDVTVQPHWHGGISYPDGQTRPVPRITRVVQVPAPDGSRIGGSPASPAEELVGAVEDEFPEVAGVVIDYTQGGIYHTPDYQDAVSRMARRHGALWIADEVVTGFGRANGWFMFQQGNERPDMVTLGKPLGAGAAPAGAVVLSKALVDELGAGSWQTYSTFRGHPLSVAAVRAHLRVLATTDLVWRSRELDEFMFRRLSRVAAEHPSVRRIDGRGLHWTIELKSAIDWRDWNGCSTENPLATRVAARAAAAGALIGTSGEESSLFLAPPLISTEANLERIVDALDHGLEVADEHAAVQEDAVPAPPAVT